MSIIRKNYHLIFLITLFLVIILFLLIKFKMLENKYEVADNSDLETINLDSKQETLTMCMIDIKGAVKNPGVYTTNCNDNVSDVIRLAGGLTEEADTSVTNLAKQVTNEMVIIIYTKEEVKNSNVVDTVVKVIEQECICPNIQNDGCINDQITDTIGGSKLININTATLEELKKIPGIGDVKAQAIINYRNANGNFKTIEDIKKVDGIGSKLYEEISIYLTT